MKRTSQHRHSTLVAVYQKHVKPGPFTIDEVVGWGLVQGLMPVPTIRDPQDVQDEWDGRLDRIERELRKGATP